MKKISNQPEEVAKQLFGYDDETLLAELEAAERELAAQIAANPELAAQLERETAEGFKKLMKHIKEEGIEPILDREFDYQHCSNSRKRDHVVIDVRFDKKGRISKSIKKKLIR